MFIRIFFLMASARVLMGTDIQAQNRDAYPKYGMTILTNSLDAIQFTDEQLTSLSKSELEFVLRINAEGGVTLLKINGIYDLTIIDSLSRTFSKAALSFYPRMEYGMPVSSIYSMTLHLPRPKLSEEEQSSPLGRYGKPGFVKSYSQSGKRLDFLIGLMVNSYSGSAAEYLNTGGGLKIDIMYGGPNFGVGMVMGLYASELKKDYPVVTTRERNKMPSTFLIGLGLNKVFLERKRSEFIMQFEINYANLVVTPKLYSNDYDNVVFSGWSPGFVANYLIRIGKDKFGSEALMINKPEPVVFKSYINIHAALRPLYLSSKEASGLMFEFGLSYRYSDNFLKGYVLK